MHLSEQPSTDEELESRDNDISEDVHELVKEEDRNKLNVGMSVQALYYADGKWYNAVLDAINPDNTYYVTFIGYGNQEVVTLNQIKVQASVLNPVVLKGKLLKAPIKIG